MSGAVPTPSEAFDGLSGRTPAITTRRIDVLTQRATKAETAIKDLSALVSALMDRLTEVEQKNPDQETLWQFTSDLQDRITALEARPATLVTKHFKDELFDKVKAFMAGHEGLKVNVAMVAENVGIGPDQTHLVLSRLNRLVTEGLVQTNKIKGRERMFWAVKAAKA